jgi:hypothetical protein
MDVGPTWGIWKPFCAMGSGWTTVRHARRVTRPMGKSRYGRPVHQTSTPPLVVVGMGLRWTLSDVEAKSMSNPDFDQTKTAVITVGEGRGFVVEAEHNRFVVTAAHCLPSIPPPFSSTDELTYPNLLGPLGAVNLTIWAECCFVDPVADVAVLGEPDNQEALEQWTAYNDLVEQAVPLAVSDILEPMHYESGWLLSLDCE